MSDELEVIVIPDPGVVAVPQPDIDVVTTEAAQPVVIESPAIEVVTIGDEDHIVDQVREIQIVTVGEVGPRGAPGDLVEGTATGDVIRYNATSGAWEAASEPLALKGLVLTPAEAALTIAEGAIFYKGSEKAIQVCTSAI